MTLNQQKPLSRSAGVLLAVSSLPSPYGIGTLGQAAFDFIDFLHAAGQSWWQMLPIGPTDCGDSPYQSFSAFAGNPYLIDLDLLKTQGLLTPDEIGDNWGDNPAQVDYALLYTRRFAVLQQAYSRFNVEQSEGYARFCHDNAYWLEDYSLFMAIKGRFDQAEWSAWPQDIRLRWPNALEHYRHHLVREIGFWKFCQYCFFSQWEALKGYAASRGVRLMGDIPIYVSFDSADVWAHPELFQLTGEYRPRAVAGVPPDIFSVTGQLWGNPLYDWGRMEADGFLWWRQRMTHSAFLFDAVRIDHFIGLVHYYAVPYGENTAEHGEWLPGPQTRLLAALNEAMGGKPIIAEDLGIVTDEVRRILKECGYPGMRILQFGFDSGPDNEHLPCHYHPNLVVYGGTHDNDTLAGFLSNQTKESLRFAREYLNVTQNARILQAILRAGHASCANLVVFQMQDYLGLGSSARMNTPSTIGGNWRWRLLPEQLTESLADQIRTMTVLYDRFSSFKEVFESASV